MCCIILIGLIAIGVIATPIILKFVKSSGWIRLKYNRNEYKI